MELSSLDPSDPQIAQLKEEVADLRACLTRLEKVSIRLDEIFRPEIGFITASLCSIAFALFCIVYFSDEEQHWYLSYIVPIGFPFVGFLFDRLDQLVQTGFCDNSKASAVCHDLVV